MNLLLTTTSDPSRVASPLFDLDLALPRNLVVSSSGLYLSRVLSGRCADVASFKGLLTQLQDTLIGNKNAVGGTLPHSNQRTNVYLGLRMYILFVGRGYECTHTHLRLLR